MADAFLASEAVDRRRVLRKGARFTTREIWEIEREALATVERDAGERAESPAGELGAERVIAARPTLKADQAEMVRRLLTDPGGVVRRDRRGRDRQDLRHRRRGRGLGAGGVELRAAAPTWRAANVMRDEGLAATEHRFPAGRA